MGELACFATPMARAANVVRCKVRTFELPSQIGSFVSDLSLQAKDCHQSGNGGFWYSSAAVGTSIMRAHCCRTALSKADPAALKSRWFSGHRCTCVFWADYRLACFDR